MNVTESAFDFERILIPFTYKLESINTFPLANMESLTIIFPLTIKLESILAPLETNKESLNINPESNCNLPPILKYPFTYKLESIKTFPLTLNESLTVALPFTYNEESIIALSLSAFKTLEPSVAIPRALILLDKLTVSVPIRSDTYCVLASKPVVGKLTLLVAVVVIVISPTPLKAKF